MAFNPFTSFRKYQKFWMATILLLCMITFVLCTGVGGDLSDRILGWFRGRGGKVMAKIDGRSIYDSDLYALKEQRQLADKFMRKALDLLDKRLEGLLMEKEKKLDEKTRGSVVDVAFDVRRRMQRKHYFETGTSFDDLINHLVWRQEADRLGITLVEKAVEQMFNDEVFFPAFFGNDDAQHVYAEVRGGSRSVSWRNIMDALRDEFRVSLAKLAIARAQVNSYELRGRYDPGLKINFPPETRIAPTPYELWEAYRKNRQEYDIALLPVSAREFLPTITYLGQVFPVPEEGDLQKLFDARKDKQYNPSLPDSGFESPHQVKVEVLTADAHSPFYQNPAKVLAQLEMGILGEGKQQVPLPVWNFGSSWISNVARFGSAHAVMDARLEQKYKDMRRHDPKSYFYARDLEDLNIRGFDGFIKALSSIPERSIPWTLYWQHGKNRATSAAALVAAGITGDSFGMAAVGRLGDELKTIEKDFAAVIKDERKSRALLAARLVGVSAGPALAPLDYALWRKDFGREFPLAQVKNEVYKQYIDSSATEAMQRNMVKARAELQGMEINQNIAEVAPRRIESLVKQYGLSRRVTGPSPYSRDGFYDRFTIHLAPELKDLKDSFLKYYSTYNNIENRSPTEAGFLKDDQFYRLFFDGQKFSVPSQALYVARPWPPDAGRSLRQNQQHLAEDPKAKEEAEQAEKNQQAVEGKEGLVIRLFNTAEKPMLFYKSQERHSSLPDKMGNNGEVYDRVLATWRLEKARDVLALPRAKAIAERLRGTPASELDAALRAEAAKLVPLSGQKDKDRLVRLPRPATSTDPGSPPFARLVKYLRAGDRSIGYSEFKVRSDDFEYPREDMAAQLQTLVDEQKPVEIGGSAKQLDEINKQLFKMKGNMAVQILANKPGTTYYVAVVLRKLDLELKDFFNVYRMGYKANAGFDEFITRAQAEMSKQFMDDLIAALRVLREVTIEASEDDRKGFREN